MPWVILDPVILCVSRVGWAVAFFAGPNTLRPEQGGRLGMDSYGAVTHHILRELSLCQIRVWPAPACDGMQKLKRLNCLAE